MHGCEFCGVEEQVLGRGVSLTDAMLLAECDARRPLRWRRAVETEEWPLHADPEDGSFDYYIHRR
ncbi:hypothetical protein DFR74_106246 [Nocardia puris]|uniref:Uncharacterized protein n=1 Tax=Nocardia puris TaxID=208602 RepID=A0A366DJV9_9NOCA|nr:hypothetical protein DFR74_106246 [Nocardia puris]